MALALTKGAPEPETAWEALTRELDLWAEAGKTATFWWRDDDAADHTEALDELLDLRGALDVPLALAVIPAAVTPTLRARLADEADVSVLQHGYSHKNFADPDARKIELDDSRPAAYVIGDLATGAQALEGFSGHLPVLVPPWNRIAPHLIPFLPELGFRGLSTHGPRARPSPITGLHANNVHVDLIDWRGRRTGQAGGFAGSAHVLDDVVGHLSARRSETVDADEATGVMTHHLVMDPASRDFIAGFVERTQKHTAVQWLSAAQVFPAP
jgi:peptidoglycan/xylan/chitin deacetylase (PgdA/CDA1 family)